MELSTVHADPMLVAVLISNLHYLMSALFVTGRQWVVMSAAVSIPTQAHDLKGRGRRLSGSG